MIHSAASSCIKNSQALSIISLSLHDPISLLPSTNSPSLTPIARLRSSKLRYTSYNTSNPPATTALSTDVHRDYRHYRLLRCRLHQQRGRQKMLHWLCVYCQRQWNNLVNSQTTHCCILKYEIGEYGTLWCGMRDNCMKIILPRTTNSLSNSPCSSPHRQSSGARDLWQSCQISPRHIHVRYHAVRHYIHDGKIQIDYISSAHQPADLFTTALETKHSNKLIEHSFFCTTPSSCIIRGGFLVSMLRCRESHITSFWYL